MKIVQDDMGYEQINDKVNCLMRDWISGTLMNKADIILSKKQREHDLTQNRVRAKKLCGIGGHFWR